MWIDILDITPSIDEVELIGEEVFSVEVWIDDDRVDTVEIPVDLSNYSDSLAFREQIDDQIMEEIYEALDELYEE
jgi:hypothetical protein